MKAKEVIEKYVKKSMRDKVEMIAFGKGRGEKDRTWWHIHSDEELPIVGFELAIHIRR